MKKWIVLVSAVLFYMTGFAQNRGVTGDWYGQLDLGAAQLRLVLHIDKDDSGELTATLDSPDQHAKGIPVDEITFQNRHLRIKVTRAMLTYSGKFDAAQQTLTGTFTQMGKQMPLSFTRNKIEPPKRPQEPQPPFPYDVEEVTFHNDQQHLTLAGTLTYPKTGDDFPAVILITGSGPENRNEEVAGHKPFLVIADYLTRHGIAVLRYDDRGVGQSTGTYAGSTIADFATDAYAAFQYLKTRDKIDSNKIGLLGHSGGGAIAPLVAAKHKAVAFVIMLAGPGVDGRQILLKQQMLMGQAADVPDTILKEQKAFFNGAFQLIQNVEDSISLRKKLTNYYREAVEQYPSFFELGQAKLSEGIFLRQMMDPWFRFVIAYNPAPTLKKVDCPVLALNGSKDLQVAARQNLPAIKKALKSGGNTAVTVKELQGLNHLFQESETGRVSEYAQITQTFSPKALKIIKDWILKRF